MTKRKPQTQHTIEPKQWSSTDEIDRATAKLQRRISELESVDVRAEVLEDTSKANVAISNVRETIRDVFGQSSPEFDDHQHIQITGAMWMFMSEADLIEEMERGRKQVIGILTGLIGRLSEKRQELESDSPPAPKVFLDHLNLHPRIADVAADLFQDGHHWPAVFDASKALVNYVKEESGKHELDGAALMRTVFSRNAPILAFNDLTNQTDSDEQEGMMHLFEGAVLGIRNIGGHSFPEGSEQRAVEYLSLISLLAYKVQEAKRCTGR